MREEKLKIIFYDENFKSPFVCTHELSYKHQKKKKPLEKLSKHGFISSYLDLLLTLLFYFPSIIYQFFFYKFPSITYRE